MKHLSLLTAAILMTTLAACETYDPKYEPETVAIPNSNYAMGKYEVTQVQWKAVMGKNPSEFKNCGDTCPVENVSWFDIQKFIQKLNAKTGKTYRLPTKSEWQRACLAGSKTEYCGGAYVDDGVAWYRDNSGGTTHPVGQKSPNAYGLYDMSGNVSEWTEDQYKDSGRVLCGGSWDGFAESVRAESCYILGPSQRNNFSGFRLVRMLP